MILSFIIPTYNRGEILNKTLLSLVKAIEGLEMEVIVVNDYKKQELVLPIKKDNITLVNNPKQGASSARNYGASLAKGEYFVFLDDDMLIDREGVDAILKLHHGKTLQSYMLNWVYPEDLISRIKKTKFGRFLIDNDLTSLKGWRGKELPWDQYAPFRVYSAASCSLVLHRNVFNAVDGYNDKFLLAGFEDYDFPKRLMEYGVEFYVYPLATIYHNESDRVDLKSFLKRKYNTSVTRKIAVNLGYTELAIKYSPAKVAVLKVLDKLQVLIYALCNALPNTVYTNFLYRQGVGILVATSIYKGYTKRQDNLDLIKLPFKVRQLNLIRTVFKIPFLENWLMRNTIDKSSSSFYAKLTPGNHQYSPGTMRQFQRNGLNFKVDLHDYMGHGIFFGFKSEEMDKLYSLINPSDTVIDVGANYGSVTLNAARIVGDSGKVYSFEPDPLNFQSCLANVSRNSFKNIVLENKGLGAETSRMFLEVHTLSNRGGNRITRNPSKEHALVEIIKLDDYVSQHNFTKVNLIKIDVEGFEFQILRGAASVLEKFKPLLFIEIDDRNLKQHGDSIKDIILFLSSIGYTNFERADNGETVHADLEFKNVHYDMICK